MSTQYVLQKHARALGVSLVLAVAVFSLAGLLTDTASWQAAWQRLSAASIVAILGLSVFNYALRFARWQLYLKALGHSIPWPIHLRCYLAGFALTVTPGKAGEALRSWLLKRHGVGYARSLAALLAERVSDVLAMTLLALGGLYYYPSYAWLIASIFIVAFILIALFRKPKTLRLIEHLPSLIPIQWIARRATDIIGLFHHAILLHRKTYLGGGIIIALLAWTAEGVGLYLITQALGLPISLGEGITIYALSVLIGALSLLPGGLGGTEAAMTWLIMAEGTSQTEAVIATFICRAATLWFAVVIGAGSLLVTDSTPPPS